MKRSISLVRLGVVPYAKALAWQERLHAELVQGLGEQVLLVLQHPPVITLGRAAKSQHVLWEEKRLQQLDIELFETGRGGDVTFHGPGQLVAYPILDLKPDRCDVRRYVADLEECMIRACGDFGLKARRVQGLNGTWVEERKIGAVGVRISRWVTMHGVALNVNTDLEYFKMIVPCGIADRGVTSLKNELGTELSMVDVEDVFAKHFETVFDCQLHDVSSDRLIPRLSE